MNLRLGNKYSYTSPHGITHELEYYRRDMLIGGGVQYHFRVKLCGILTSLVLQPEELEELSPLRQAIKESEAGK